MALREDEARMSTYEQHHPPCLECETLCNYEWIPSVPLVNWKDGETGSFIGKTIRYQKYRKDLHEKLGKKQKDRYGHLNRDAIPNFQGREVESWREAASFALKENGKESAATYEPKIKKEVAKKNSKK